MKTMILVIIAVAILPFSLTSCSNASTTGTQPSNMRGGAGTAPSSPTGLGGGDRGYGTGSYGGGMGGMGGSPR